MNRYWLITGCLIAGFTGVMGCAAPARAAGGYEGCATIDDDALRLRCYDEAAGRRPKDPAATAAVSPAQTTPAAESRPSVLSRMWQLDDESRRRRFAIMPYRQNYFLPYTYNFTQEKQTYEAANSGTEIQDAEAKYQLSLKMKLWEDILGTNMDLWAAYTQLSFWQLYNSGFSSPFRETNYEPEILLNYRTDTDLFGLLKSRFIQVGLNHQSNGRGNPLSRSWNRVMANFGFERDDLNLSSRPGPVSPRPTPRTTTRTSHPTSATGRFGWNRLEELPPGTHVPEQPALRENRSVLQCELTSPSSST